MFGTHKKILKQITYFILCLQLIFALSGFIANVNPSECSHTKKAIKKVHSCCEMMTEETQIKCEFSKPITRYNFSNCECIHSSSNKNSDYTIQKNFELQKEDYFAMISYFPDNQKKLISFHFIQQINNEHSPPLYLLSSTLLI